MGSQFESANKQNLKKNHHLETIQSIHIPTLLRFATDVFIMPVTNNNFNSIYQTGVSRKRSFSDSPQSSNRTINSVGSQDRQYSETNMLPQIKKARQPLGDITNSYH